MAATFPNWKDMPETRTICSLDWHDIYDQIEEKLKQEPTKELIIDVFLELEDKLTDAMSEQFADTHDFLLDEILEEKERKNPNAS